MLLASGNLDGLPQLNLPDDRNGQVAHFFLSSENPFLFFFMDQKDPSSVAPAPSTPRGGRLGAVCFGVGLQEGRPQRDPSPGVLLSPLKANSWRFVKQQC